MTTATTTPLTADMIRRMPAGRELDRLIRDRFFPLEGRFSTDLAAAFRVVECLAAKGARVVIADWRDGEAGATTGWCVLFDLPGGHDTGQLVADALPLAISRAALLATLEAL